MAKVLMKGNEAFAEAAIRAGCRFFSGYPITPQTEILEYMSWRIMPSASISFFYSLPDFEKATSSRNTIGFERRSNCKADGLVGAAFVRYDQDGIHWIESTFLAFYRCVKALKINCYICTRAHASVNLLSPIK